MLAEVSDDELGASLVPDEVDRHAYIGVAAAHGDMFGEEGRLAVVFKSVTVAMIANDSVRDLWAVELAECGVLCERPQSMKRDIFALPLRREGG